MNADDAIAALRARAEPGRAEQMSAYHKQTREVLGVPNTVLNDLAKGWRQDLTIPQRVQFAGQMWNTNIFEARIVAAKVLTQARMRGDEDVWRLIASWVPDFDGWAIADHACDAGERRLMADPGRIDEVEGWTRSNHMWTRRAALVITLPWTKQNHPSEEDLIVRDRVLGWAALYADDQEWFIQKAIAWWLRDLSKHDRERTRSFLDLYGSRLKPFARKEAGKYL